VERAVWQNVGVGGAQPDVAHFAAVSPAVKSVHSVPKPALFQSHPTGSFQSHQLAVEDNYITLGRKFSHTRGPSTSKMFCTPTFLWALHFCKTLTFRDRDETFVALETLLSVIDCNYRSRCYLSRSLFLAC